MVVLIKTLLGTSDQADFFGKKIFLDSLLIIGLMLFHSIGTEPYFMRNTLFFLAISIFAYQLATLFYRNQSDFVLLMSPLSPVSKVLLFLTCALIQNSLYLIALCMNLYLLGFTPLLSLSLGLIYYMYAIALGLSSGYICKQITGLTIPFAFTSLFFFCNDWTANEFVRTLSVNTQLYRPNHMDLSNLLGIVSFSIVCVLLLLSCFFYRYKKHARFVILIGVLGMCGFSVKYELDYNLKNQVQLMTNHRFTFSASIDEADQYKLTEFLSILEETFVTYAIIDPFDQFRINRYYTNIYLDSLYQTRRIPYQNLGDTFQMNIYSEAMLNFDDLQLANNMIDRILQHMPNSPSNRYTQNMINDIFNKTIYPKLLDATFLSSSEKENILFQPVDRELNPILAQILTLPPHQVGLLYHAIETVQPNSLNQLEILVDHLLEERYIYE